jgi:hypothetical protein
MHKAICLSLISSLVVGAVVAIPIAPAHGWLLPAIFRAVAISAAKEELRARYARCKRQPQTCRRVKAKTLRRAKAICTKTRLSNACKKFKYGRRRVANAS